MVLQLQSKKGNQCNQEQSVEKDETANSRMRQSLKNVKLELRESHMRVFAAMVACRQAFGVVDWGGFQEALVNSRGYFASRELLCFDQHLQWRSTEVISKCGDVVTEQQFDYIHRYWGLALAFQTAMKWRSSFCIFLFNGCWVCFFR